MRVCLFIVWVCVVMSAYGQDQDVAFDIAPKLLKTGEKFSIKVFIKGPVGDQISDFPQMAGLKKEAREVRHAKQIYNGRKIIQHTAVQYYIAEIPGVYSFENTKMTVNGRSYPLQGISIIVQASEEQISEALLTETANNPALLFLFVNKKEIFMGESFRIHLAFYVSEENTVAWEFPQNLSAQIRKLSELLKPKNCLESQAVITHIVEEPALINNKKYKRYKLLEAVYYPLNTDKIILPASTLLINRADKTDSTKTEQVRFTSKAFTLAVKPLPEHPLRDKVAAGSFKLIEKPKTEKIPTGKIMNITLGINGLGNFHTLTFNKPLNDEHFDFYPAVGSIRQKNGSESGQHDFTFKVFPKDSGNYALGDYFQWIFFNTETAAYDTLRARQQLQVIGSKITTFAGNTSDIYYKLGEKSISEKEINYHRVAKNLANVLLFLMLVGMLFIFDFKRK